MLLRGKQKSERSALNTAAMEKLTEKEVEHGWSLPLKIDSLCHIEKAGVAPLGVAEQLSINEKVECYTKIGVTHEFYFPGSSGICVNQRVLKDTLQTYFYGFFLLRLLHMVAAIRIKWPSKHILIGKNRSRC